MSLCGDLSDVFLWAGVISFAERGRVPFSARCVRGVYCQHDGRLRIQTSTTWLTRASGCPQQSHAAHLPCCALEGGPCAPPGRWDSASPTPGAPTLRGFPGDSEVKKLSADARDSASTPGPGRSRMPPSPCATTLEPVL